MSLSTQDYDILARLLEAGADITLRDNLLGETALHTSMRTCKTTKEMMLTCLLFGKAQENRK